MQVRNRFISAAVCLIVGVALCVASLTIHHSHIRWLSAPGLFLILLGGILMKRVWAHQSASKLDWYEVTGKYDELTYPHDAKLTSLPEEWQRELAALWRVESNVNNGAYLQFLQNCGMETYAYASKALKKIGAHRMAEIIDECQALVDEHVDFEGMSVEQKGMLMPNAVINMEGKLIKERGSLLPDSVIKRIYELSYEFMKYPDDVPTLGLAYYAPILRRDE